MTQYAGDYEVHGIDLNARMVDIARRNLRKAGLSAELCQGNVESMPYPDGSFDTVLSTMAFSGYPDAHRALSEMLRVLKPGGRLVLVDVNYPGDANRLGTWLTMLWQRAGDLIRDMDALFRSHDLSWADREIGGWGSIHLYVAVSICDSVLATSGCSHIKALQRAKRHRTATMSSNGCQLAFEPRALVICTRA